MSNINKNAVLNPFTDLTANILDYVPRATTSEFGIVAIGSGINVDNLGRIYLDTQEYSDRLTAIEEEAASTLSTQKSEVAAAIAQVNLTQSQTISDLTTEVNTLKTNLTDSITATQNDLIARADQLAQDVTDITQQLDQDKAAFTQEIQDALVYLENAESVASALRTPRKINGVDFDGTQDITLPLASTSVSGTVQLNDTLTSTATDQALTAAQGKVLNNNKLDRTENAVSATKLENSRTIGGVPFDGTADINLAGVNIAGNQDTSGNAATATKLANARTISLTGGVTGSVSFDGSANATIATTVTGLGAANGIATLDSSGKVPSTQLPSYVDDVLEYQNVSAFPTTGETGKIYVETTGNTTYRWGGSSYVKITSGEVSSVAGKVGVVTLSKADVGLANADNTADVDKPISTVTQEALNKKVNITDIVDNLTTDDATKPISAKQVKLLQDTKLDKNSNAVSASKLNNKVKLNGADFDGSTGITVPALSSAIPANADLNDYRTPGFYYCSGSGIAATIANTAFTFAFSLLVESAATVKQTFTQYNSGLTAIRVYNIDSSTWTPWKTVAFTDSNITGTSANITGVVSIANGGTGATTAAAARNNLGLPGINAERQFVENLGITGSTFPNIALIPSSEGGKALILETSGSNHYFLIRNKATYQTSTSDQVMYHLPNKTGIHTFAMTSDLGTVAGRTLTTGITDFSSGRIQKIGDSYVSYGYVNDGVDAMTTDSSNAWNAPKNTSFSVQNSNNMLAVNVGYGHNERKASIQVGHNEAGYAGATGVLALNPLGGAVTVNKSQVLTGGNTTVDSNGFIKRASPIIKLFADNIELNDEAQLQEIVFEKLGKGDYLIKGSTGLSNDGWYIEQPKDANGNVYHAVVYEQLEKGDISVKTFEQKLEGTRIVADLEKPVDIKEDRFISIRLNELPQDTTAPQNPNIVDNEGNPAPSRLHELVEGAWILSDENAAILEQERLAAMKPLKRRQFRLTLAMNGYDLNEIEALINQIEDPMQRTIAQIEWQDATDFERTNPTLLMMAQMLGLTSEQVDSLWEYGLAL